METVEQYLKRGGKITVVPPGVSGLDKEGLMDAIQLNPHKRKARNYQKRLKKRSR